MERIKPLIDKLNQQFEEGAEPAQLLATLQQIQNELSVVQPKPAKVLGTSKVAVMMPAGMPIGYEKYLPKTPVEEQKIAEVIDMTETVQETAQETVTASPNSNSIVHTNGKLDMVFDPLTEIPTLSHQIRENFVDNNTKNFAPSESLNDRLKQPKSELFEVLKEIPIKDLRKAIGINDRFLFIDDLFRGDEAMYERSIKTINSFNIFPEAEYWISRELKVKLGWDNENKTVQHFDQLIKRRFS